MIRDDSDQYQDDARMERHEHHRAEAEDDLTVSYLAGFHKRDDEVAALKAEVARLRECVEVRDRPDEEGYCPYCCERGGGHFSDCPILTHPLDKEGCNG